MPKKMAKEDFIAISEDAHGKGRYDYSRVEYINHRTKVDIICNFCHAEFSQTPSGHKRGSGCKNCGNMIAKASAAVSNARRRDQAAKEFVDKASEVHGNFYGYDKVSYKNNKTCVAINCPTHGEFQQRPYNHLQGEGCPACRLLDYDGISYVYLVTMELGGEEWVKVGVTAYDTKVRFSATEYQWHTIKEVAVLPFNRIKDAQTVEKHIQNKHKKHQFTPKVKFAGHTECFNIEALETIKQDFGV